MSRPADYNASIPALLLLALVTSASPAHATVFAPPARSSRYTFMTTTEPIEAAAAEYRKNHPSPDRRSWVIEETWILEVFDAAALYDRARLARLYRGTAARAARGPITNSGSVTHAVLLLSPYPEPDLTRLNPGTLIMVVSTR